MKRTPPGVQTYGGEGQTERRRRFSETLGGRRTFGGTDLDGVSSSKEGGSSLSSSHTEIEDVSFDLR